MVVIPLQSLYVLVNLVLDRLLLLLDHVLQFHDVLHLFPQALDANPDFIHQHIDLLVFFVPLVDLFAIFWCLAQGSIRVAFMDLVIILINFLQHYISKCGHFALRSVSVVALYLCCGMFPT